MIKGLDDALKGLEALGKSLDGKAIQDVLREAGKPMVRQIQSGIVSKWKLPPNIYDFVTKNDSKYRSAKGASVLLGWNRTNVKAFKGIFFELGTLGQRIEPLKQSRRVRKDGKKWSEKALTSGGIIARPVIRPAFDKNKKEIEKTIGKGLTKLIFDTARKNNLEI
jgi:HK97 gp10 family phage protein